MKYVVMSHPERAVKTLRERAQAITQPLADIGDLTSSNIRYLQFMEREAERDEMPAQLVRLPRLRLRRGRGQF